MKKKLIINKKNQKYLPYSHSTEAMLDHVTLKEVVSEVMKHNVNTPMSIDDVLDVITANDAYDFRRCQTPRASVSHALSTDNTYVRIKQGIYVYTAQGSTINVIKKSMRAKHAIRSSCLQKTVESDSSSREKMGKMAHKRKTASENEPVAKRVSKIKLPHILPKPPPAADTFMGDVVKFPIVFHSHQEVMSYACFSAHRFLAQGTSLLSPGTSKEA